jgi:hypothetical protein
VRPAATRALGGDLPTEDTRYDRRAGRAPEDVLLDPLQVEQIEQDVKCFSHG